MDDATATGPTSPRPSPPTLSVVLSFRNEEENIPELVKRLRAVIDELKGASRLTWGELVFVNDDSTDKSLELLKELARDRPDIRVVNMARNFGVSPCVLAGMERSRGDLVVYMDADLQDPPEIIPQMLAAWEEGAGVDVVHTVRTSRAGESWYKLLITRIGYAILRRVSTIDLPIQAGDFKLLSRRAVTLLVQFQEKRPFVRGLVCWIGLKQVKITYHREPRFSGKTKFPIFGLGVIQNFLDSAVISFSDVPLKLAMAMGVAVSVCALLFIVWVLLEKFRGHNLPGWTAIMVASLLLGGIQLFCIGLQGLYIGSIFAETKRRPNHIVKDTFGFDAPAASDGHDPSS
jgi:dolichol-phosphate mannosyltransferase